MYFSGRWQRRLWDLARERFKPLKYVVESFSSRTLNYLEYTLRHGM